MSKKIISLTLTLVIALGLFSSTALAADDNPSSWAAEQINRAIAENLVPQSLQSKYSQAATRAEFCALAVALYENVKGTITDRTIFSDTNDINVEKAASIGVVSGVGGNKFDPDAKLTREQAAVMLSRLADAVGKPFETQAATFADNSMVSSWALTGVGQVQAAGIMGGVGGNTFAPHDPYTREQSIITILRTYDAVKGGETTTEPSNEDTNQNLIGTWGPSVHLNYTFYEDGTFLFERTESGGSLDYQVKGSWRFSNDTIYFTNQMYRSKSYTDSDYGTWGKHSQGDTSMRVILGSDNGGGAYWYDEYFIELDSDLVYRKMEPFWREGSIWVEGTNVNVNNPNANKSWTGTWETSQKYWGMITLTQNGDKVEGTFSGTSTGDIYSGGKISGKVSGNTVVFTLTQNDGIVEAYVNRFIMSGNGKSFEIQYLSDDVWIPSTDAIRK